MLIRLALALGTAPSLLFIRLGSARLNQAPRFAAVWLELASRY